MGFRITWVDNNVAEEGHHIYRSQASMAGLDVAQLPAPYATVGPDVTAFEDGEVTPGGTYYYRVGAFTASGSVVLVGGEVELLAEESAVPVNGLLIWYAMDDVSGSTMPDSAGTQDGIVYGASPVADPDLGPCLYFDGSNDYADGGLSPLGSAPSAFSVSVVLKGGGNGDYVYAVNCNHEDQVGNGHFHFGSENSGKWTVNADGNWAAGTTSVAMDTTPRHFVLVYDGNEMVVYVDGVEDVRAAIGPVENTANLKNINFGHVDAVSAITNTTRRYKGYMRDFLLYDRALLPAEVASLNQSLGV